MCRGQRTDCDSNQCWPVWIKQFVKFEYMNIIQYLSDNSLWPFLSWKNVHIDEAMSSCSVCRLNSMISDIYTS